MAKAIAITEESRAGLEQLKSGPARLSAFLKDVRSEMRKVVTPSRTEVQATTVVVIATVFIFAAYFAVVDFAVGHAFDVLLRKLTAQ